MKYDLSVKERLIFLGCLPPRGDIVTLKIVRDLQDVIGFKEEEIVALKLETKEDGTVHWDEKAEFNKEVEMGEKAMDLIVDSLKEMDRKKQLTSQHLEVYEKFVDGGQK